MVEANYFGGAQRIAINICDDWRQTNNRYSFLLINKFDAEHQMKTYLENNNINCIEVNLFLIRKIPSFRIARFLEVMMISFAFVRALTKFKIDLIHFHIFQGFYLIPLFRIIAFLRIPFLWTLHGDVDYPCSTMRTMLRVMKKINDKCIRFQITKVSQNTCLQLTKELMTVNKELIVIPNGIDLERFSYSKKARTTLRNSLKIPQDGILIGAVGRLEKEKGFDVLIKAFKSMPDMDIKNLVIIGEGSLNDEFDQLINSYHLSDKVMMVGAKDNIPDWLSAFDIFVQPSRGEGFGLSILEAMSVGLPVIASDVGGIPALLDNGKAGLLVHPESIDELVAAIYTLSIDKDLRQKYSSEATKRAQDYSASKMTDEYNQIYQSLITS